MSADLEQFQKKVSRQADYVRRTRIFLLNFFSNKCALCPCDNPDLLEFDHIHGRDYVANKLSSVARMARYKREAKAGELRLLCKDCNLKARKTNDNGQFVPTAADVPLTANIPF